VRTVGYVQPGRMFEFDVRADDGPWYVELLPAPHAPGLYRVCVSLAVLAAGPGYVWTEAFWSDTRLGAVSAAGAYNVSTEFDGATECPSPGGVLHSAGDAPIGLAVHMFADQPETCVGVSAAATRLA